MINDVFIKSSLLFFLIFVLFPRKVEWILVSGTAETQATSYLNVSGLTLSVD